MTTIECRQLAPAVGALAANHERIIDAIRASDADVLVLPELATSGYSFTAVAEVEACAVPAASLTGWSRLLDGNRVVVAGFAERAEDGALYNSAAVVSAAGVLGVYRKAHLWDKEKLYFTPGAQPPLVVDTPHGRLGVIVCFDLEFPEWTRRAGMAGVDLLAVPTNWPLGPRPDGERPAEVVIAQAAARVNRMAIACCDRSGNDRGQTWTQGTVIIDADGWLATDVGDDVTRADLDLTKSRNKRLTERVHLFDDRRTDLY